MKEAHDAIFAAEKDIMDDLVSFMPEVAEIEAKATSLKSLIVQPSWKKSEITEAIEVLKQARAKLQQKLDQPEVEVMGEQEAEAIAAE